nr:MAG TPA: hypothetical protein [Herelleviridae sp.]
MLHEFRSLRVRAVRPRPILRYQPPQSVQPALYPSPMPLLSLMLNNSIIVVTQYILHENQKKRTPEHCYSGVRQVTVHVTISSLLPAHSELPGDRSSHHR